MQPGEVDGILLDSCKMQRQDVILVVFVFVRMWNVAQKGFLD
jgi:hypothetical protein